MDKGAIVDNETDYDNRVVSSRLEWAMRLMIENEESFWSEQQNKPRGVRKASVFVDAVTIRNKLNGYERGIVPIEAQHLTAFIDVHDNLLYWVIVAWADDFTGYIIDYGTYPEQIKTYFSKENKNNITLQKKYKGLKRLGCIRIGVEELVKELLSREFQVINKTTIYLERIMIDTGYEFRPVEMAMARIRSPLVTPTKGFGIMARDKPMDEYPDRPGEVRGFHWLFTKIGDKRRYKALKIDTNFWKTDIHDSLGLSLGDRGGLSLWGLEPDVHQMFSEHLTSEDVVLVKARENEIYEWTQKNSGGDNHFFDCIVGCAVAASFIGIKKPYEKDDVPIKRRRARCY
jgi:phage terminase large subunit GpA-like protein